MKTIREFATIRPSAQSFATLRRRLPMGELILGFWMGYFGGRLVYFNTCGILGRSSFVCLDGRFGGHHVLVCEDDS